MDGPGGRPHPGDQKQGLAVAVRSSQPSSLWHGGELSWKQYVMLLSITKCTCFSLNRFMRLCVCPTVTLMYRGHIGWTSSKLITRIISSGSLALPRGATTSVIQSKETTPKIQVEQRWGHSQQETCNICETGQGRTKVIIDDEQEVALHAFDCCQNQRPWMTLKDTFKLTQHIHPRCHNVTDRQADKHTDKRTDGRLTIAMQVHRAVKSNYERRRLRLRHNVARTFKTCHL